ncbi:DUF6634 family protein [Mesorhizobium calcicola]|uniref:DUF6634 family protein n=1 Tax=Mesorhizobium calcicola TaxID=1300310 RepID=A0ABW4WD02_9HYPH
MASFNPPKPHGDSGTAGKRLGGEQKITGSKYSRLPATRKRDAMLRFGPNIDLDLTAFGEERVRLDALVADLWYVSLNKRPASSSTHDAPILEEWRLALRPTLCLVGLATGHPKLPGHQRAIVTSGLSMFSEQLGLGRTESRWYQLGKPAGDVPEHS